MLRSKLFSSIFLFSCIALSCSNNNETLTTKQSTAVRDSVGQLMKTIANDISHDGPVAWLRYFENTSDFFMASEGVLVFPDNISATNFVKDTLVKTIHKIELRWNNVRVDPMTNDLASTGALFHEDITVASGKIVSQDGYFTAVTHKTSQGWKLRNAHWSVIRPANTERL